MDALEPIGMGTAAGLLLGILICFALPIGGLIWCKKKYGRVFVPFVLGMAAFVVSQLFLRIPLIQRVLPQMDWYAQLPYKSYFLYALFLAFTAGLFEETARYICVRFFLKNNRSYGDAIIFGFGHGGVEAVLLTALTFINYLTYCMMINKGTFAAAMAELPQAQYDYLLSVIYSLGFGSALMGSAERIIAVALHIGMTVIVFRGFAVGKPGLHLVYAILVHTVVDLFAVLLPALGVSGWPMELIFAAMTALVWVLAIWMKKHTDWPARPQYAPVAAPSEESSGEAAEEPKEWDAEVKESDTEAEGAEK